MTTLKLLLQRDFYILVSDFCSELSIPKSKYFGGLQIKLSELSSKYSEDISKKISLLFEAHRERWASLQYKPGYIEGNDRLTNQTLETPGRFPTPCPACKNRAVIYTKEITEFNKFENRDVVVGLKVNELKCRYCKLHISDYIDLDYLKLDTLVRTQVVNPE